jgi:hypothetical protein
MAYTTIYIAPGLSEGPRLRARRSGPRAVATRGDQLRLLVSAGYIDAQVLDQTAEFAVTARAWLSAWEANADELSALESPAAFAERQRERTNQLRAIEDGLLRRGLFSATRPPLRPSHGGNRRNDE